MAQFYLGQIIQGGWNFAPQGTQMCNGQILPIQQYTALFSLIGTYYGGNGVQTFQLPNLQGRVPMHQGNGAGLTPRVIGESFGTENASLLVQNMPLHTHAGTLSAQGSNKATLQAPSAGATLAHSQDLAGTGSLPAIYYPSGTTPNTALGGLTIGNTGGNVPFAILPPVLVITFCIVMNGIFPSRN
jgi:microcystin-dependent protein